MGRHLVVVDSPGLDLGERAGEVDEPVLVQTPVPELPVEGLGEALSTGLPGPMKWDGPRAFSSLAPRGDVKATFHGLDEMLRREEMVK